MKRTVSDRFEREAEEAADAVRYVEDNAFAAALSRRTSEGRVERDQMRRLADAADQLERTRRTA